ncbi:MAG TPA: hypothetical protein VHA78_05595 [Candidatus Peribacteraceae bacterium]|nr:hypothetical protein [Candidatus Peribacteraceae bacterium]
MEPTSTSTPQPPKILRGQEIYDLIMSQIEPDLVSTQLPLLAQKYATETPEDKKARAQRYNKAFAEYDKKFQEYCDTWDADLRAYKRQAIQTIEKNAREGQETDQLASIEHSLTSS